MTVFWQRYETRNSLDNNYCCSNRTENVGQKLYTDKLSAQLFDDLRAETVNCQIQEWCKDCLTEKKQASWHTD